MNYTNTPINKIGKVVTGKTPSTSISEYYDGDIMFITPTELHSDYVVTKSEKTISQKGFDSIRSNTISGTSVMVGCIGWDMGNVAVCKETCATNQQINSIVPERKRISGDFLYYSLVNNYDILRIYGGDGTAVPIVNKSDFESIEIDLPPLPEQRAIAEVLSSLDDKIDLLHRENKTLEQMAEALFRQWFVEEASDDWEECTLNDLCIEIASGGTPSTKVESYYNGNINWYITKELKDNFLYDSMNKITEDGLKNSAARLFPKETVLVAIYAAPTVGRLGILATEAAFNQATCGLVANKDFCSPEFIYLYLKMQRGDLTLIASGSAQQNLNVGKIKSYPAFIVPKDLMDKFNEIVKPIFKKINSNTRQINILEKLRDILLPKLMSGEVRVTLPEEST